VTETDEAANSEIDAAQLRARLDAGDVQLIDVRADHEWEAGRIPGATHIELNEIAPRASELDPDRPVVLYCRGGGRSEMATSALREAGFDAVKLAGGIVGWAEAGSPLEPEGGYVAESGEAAARLHAEKRLPIE